MKTFAVAPKIQYGSLSISSLAELDSKKALIVTDKFMVQFGIVKRVTDNLDKKGITYSIFDGVEPNPSLETVVKILKELISSQADSVIALGGGSPIDAAKGALYFAAKVQKMFSGISTEKRPYFVAIPTTSGTGSEVTSYSVLTDTKKQTKIALSDDSMLPDLAILDPDFTKTLPKSVIADTGMDVLTHAIEAYVSKESNSYTDALSMGAIEKVFKHLLANYTDVEVEENRIEMQNASCMAGIAFNNSSLGINHSIAHALGGRFHIPHGKINAILMPYIVSYNSGIMCGKENQAAKRYSNIAKQLGFPASTPLEGSFCLVKAIEILKQEMGIPKNLHEFGILESEYMNSLDEISELAYNDICTAGNPVSVSKSDLKEIMLKVYNG